ncbi:Assimilatory nitrate reductase catalytic subunit [Meiothermus luteus]|uniref:Assimilatory nitrate reductase catalytic subunit n=2 Tax=Meiothermus luteus TaxID=2026184 RepID=A0A399F4D2_9DEIN|nr:Assimilatory nitrate reductase catalytic subunit [Meiothermus luteus]RMH57825.1 MAG: nitrite reductase [Deinococcota bacterium]
MEAICSIPTHCCFCAMQCAMQLHADGTVKPLPHPINGGKLCVLGLTSGELLGHTERLRTPLVRKGGRLEPTSWEEALEVAVQGFQRIAAEHGRSANAVYGGASLSNEKAYLLGKFARLALQTPHVDYNGRYCMSAAAAAQNLAFGLDRGLNRPLADLPQHDVILLVGSNAAECLPMLMPHLQRAKEGGTRFIVVDPRRTTTANLAALHLAVRPSTDLALANSLLYLLAREQRLDHSFIAERTQGFREALRAVQGCTAAWASEVCGLMPYEVEQAALLLASARKALILTGRGADQNSRGVATSLAFINLALALGAEFGTLTGQANGQGGREMGQKADQLPGYRSIEDPADRQAVARVWGVEPEQLPGKGYSAFEILQAVARGEIRGMLVMGSNPIPSSPRSDWVRESLERMEHLVVIDSFLSETARHARVVLPGALWSEEDGTTTNLEGRVVLRRAVRLPPAGARSDLEILCDLATRLGAGQYFSYSGPKEVYDELRRATRGAKADYYGITWERLEAGEELFWPCPSEDHPGTPRPFAQRFAHADGRARFSPTPFRPSAEEPAAAYPLYLTTGRVLYHYLTGNHTRRLGRLFRKCPEPLLEVHPETAQRLGLAEGELAEVSSPRASARYRVKHNPKIRPDTLFVPFHWDGQQAVNRLMNPALDPICQMPEFKVAAVSLTPVAHSEAIAVAAD